MSMKIGLYIDLNVHREIISLTKKITYIGLTTTTLTRRLILHLSETRSIAQHFKTQSGPSSQ